MAALPAGKPWVLFDWGGTLMSEEGPLDLPMALWPEVKAIPGAHETLATLAGRFRIGVATNASISTRNMIEVALGRVGLRDHVTDVFCYSDIGARKDSDEFWRAVLERLGVEPANVAMIGDSVEQDVVAPRDFGIYSVWFNEEGRHPPDPRGRPMITSLPEAIPLVRTVFAAP
jgi:HAD superfamily hydrolase (TIGR01509 family)